MDCDFATLEGENVSTRQPSQIAQSGRQCSEKVARKVAGRQSRNLGLQRLPKVAQLAN